MNTGEDKLLVPELEDHLVKTAARKIDRTAPRAVRPHRRRSGWRALGVAAASLAVTGTAFAAVSGWSPSIGDLSEGGPPTLSSRGLPAEIEANLGVLRRSSPRDQGPAVEETLHRAGKDIVDGVHLDSIRYLASGPDGRATVLMVVEHTGPSPGPFLCVFHPINADYFVGEGIPLCSGLSELLDGLAVSTFEGPHLSDTYGLVPDGVASVTAILAGGNKRRVEVHNNFYSVNSDSERLSVRNIVWHDPEGHVIPAAKQAKFIEQVKEPQSRD